MEPSQKAIMYNPTGEDETPIVHVHHRNINLDGSSQPKLSNEIALPEEIMLDIIRSFVKVDNPITSRTFASIFAARAAKAVKITGWYKDVVNMFYRENLIRLSVPQGSLYNEVYHTMEFFRDYLDWCPSVQITKRIHNLEVNLKVDLVPTDSHDLTLRTIFGKYDVCLGLFFTLNDPAFDMLGSNLAPLYRYTRTEWQKRFTSLNYLKIVLDVGVHCGNGAFCFIAQHVPSATAVLQNAGFPQIDQLKLSLERVHVKLRPEQVEVECRLRDGSVMRKCECGCFKAVEDLIAIKVELRK